MMKSYINKFQEVAARWVEKIPDGKKMYAKLHRTFYMFKKSKFDEESVETRVERINMLSLYFA